MADKIQFLAYYLPQFHPIPENDSWWGKGFTEWTNVTKAQPLFKGHNQPIMPGELGFYDLRIPEIQEQQALLAKSYGIDGFVYYQYWFGKGKMLLEKPAEAMLNNKNIDFPFCFCWANETWKGIWHGIHDPRVLIEQTYQGKEGYQAYFEYLLPFFQDKRYIKEQNKPVFHVYKLDDIPDLAVFVTTFNELAIQEGFDGIHLIATICSEAVLNSDFVYGKVGVDVFMKMRYSQKTMSLKNSIYLTLERKYNKITNSLFRKNKSIDERSKPLIFDYQKGVAKMNSSFTSLKHISCVFPNWDNTARTGKKAMIFINATPLSWKVHLQNTVNELLKNPHNPQIVIIKSWNEWAEGNYIEPDATYGRQWLEVVKSVKMDLLSR
tara:strand:+ start:3722 stop:4858 length:1137 start_codon:yes stop_codon:yes gene_type:complete